MTATATELNFEINPKFLYASRVHWDELDPLQMLHNSRFAAHVERAVIAHKIKADRLRADGVGPLAPVASNRDDAGKARNRRVELVEQ